MAQTIQEVFKQFCKERHAEDKGKNHDLLQEIYASTEFFDTSLLEAECPNLENFSHTDYLYKANFTIKEFNLPFQNSFIKVDNNQFLFIREYSPEIITGTYYFVDYQYEEPIKHRMIKGNLNCPFTIHLSGLYPSIVMDMDFFEKEEKYEDDNDFFAEDLMLDIIVVCDTLNNLPHKAIAVDKPTNTFYEYYRRKRKPTIKIPQRPIYYVLGDKGQDVSAKYRYIQPKGTLEYSYAFKVRGHWRRVDDKTYGKDRNGIYNVKGYTWVTEHTKGEGELAKRIRVIK